MSRISLTKDILIVIGILFSCVVYFSPGNFLGNDFHYLRSILRSFYLELLVIALVLIMYLFRLHRKFLTLYFKVGGLSVEQFRKRSIPQIFLLGVVLLFSFTVLMPPIYTIYVNRKFFYSDIVGNRFIDEMLGRGKLYEETGQWDEALVTYKKVLSILNDTNLIESIQSRVDKLEARKSISLEVLQRSDIINGDLLITKGDLALIRLANQLSPDNEFIQKVFEESTTKVKTAVDELADIVNQEGYKCVDQHIDTYGWLLLDADLLQLIDVGDRCSFIDNRIDFIGRKNIRDKLLKQWYIVSGTQFIP